MHIQRIHTVICDATVCPLVSMNTLPGYKYEINSKGKERNMELLNKLCLGKSAVKNQVQFRYLLHNSVLALEIKFV
jgi:hypothetical protein